MTLLTIKNPGGVLVRVLVAINGFRATFGTWPDTVEAPVGTIADVENHCLTPLGLERLRNKITLRPSRDIVAALGRQGADRFEYMQGGQGHDAFPDVARQWLGLGEWTDQFAEDCENPCVGRAVKSEGGVLVRVLQAIDAFHAAHGYWPDTVVSNLDTFDVLLNHHLTDVGARRLRDRVKLIASPTYQLLATGREGADVFDYVANGWSADVPQVAKKWLKLDQEHEGPQSPEVSGPESTTLQKQLPSASKKMSSTVLPPEIFSQIVYVLTNPSMPGLVKIGKTTQVEVEMRMKQLYGTGVPVPFDCVFACQVKDAHEVEKVLHFAFGNDRINPNREFFRIEPERVVAVLKLLEVKDITGQFEMQIEADVTTADRQSAQQMKDRRPRMNFIDMGIPVGSVLISKDGQAEAVVISDRLVSFQGADQSLTAATRKVLGLEPDAAIQPSPYWTFYGKSVKKIYDEYHDSDAV